MSHHRSHQNAYDQQSDFADHQVSIHHHHAEWRRHVLASPVTVPLQSSPNEIDYETPQHSPDNRKAWENIRGFDDYPALNASSPGYDQYHKTPMLNNSPAAPTTPVNRPAYGAHGDYQVDSPIGLEMITEPNLGNHGMISSSTTHHGRAIQGTISSPFPSLKNNAINPPQPTPSPLTTQLRREPHHLGQPGHSVAPTNFSGPNAGALKSPAAASSSGKKAPTTVAVKRKAQPEVQESRGYKRKSAEEIAEIENYGEKREANNVAVKICRAQEKARTKEIFERLVYLEELIESLADVNVDSAMITALLEECRKDAIVLNDKERKKIGLPPNH